ncbi:MAG: DNA polymerase III subunit beta [Campylobacter sp.]|nr:DNA polymerase III subunit beta [Campylobacter sp.]
MKFIINKNMLTNILTNVSSYIDKKDISSIISHIFIEANNGVLTIKATDYEIGLAYNIKSLNIEIDGAATANGTTILNILKGLKDEDVIVETINDFLYLRQKKAKFKLPMYSSLDFPEFPKTEDKAKFDINSNIFSRSLKKIIPTIDNNNPNYALNGAFIDPKDGYINLVGTDAKRLGLFKLETNSQNSDNSNIIIPKKAITEMQKLNFENAEIYYDYSIFIIKSESFEFFAKLINKKFPEYQRVIPNDFKETITLPRDKFIEGIKTISMICEKMSITIRLNSITFESISDDNNEAKTEIECQTALKDDIVIRVNNRYLTDFLTSIETNNFELRYNNSESAFVVISDNLLNVIMPTII